MEWSTDIDSAPRGNMEIRQRGEKGKETSYSVFVPDVIWAASKCGKVIRTYWLPDRHGWLSFGHGEQPVAWRSFIDGEFPSHVDPTTKKYVYPNGKTPDFPTEILRKEPA